MSDLTTKAAEIRAGLVAELRLAERIFKEDAEDRAAYSTGCVFERAAALIEQQAAELAEARAENERLRAALANSDQPCAYCSLPKEEWAKCASGFPGCDRADDAMGCPELGASLRATTAEAERDSWRRVCERLETEKQAALAERDELLREKERMGRQLRALAIALHAKHYGDAPGWMPLDDAEGLLSQIDNMTTGLSRAASSALENGPAGLADANQHEGMPATSNPQSACAGEEVGQSAGEVQQQRTASPALADANSKSPDPTPSQSERIAVLCPHAPTYDAGLCCGHPDDCTFVSPAALAPLGEE